LASSWRWISGHIDTGTVERTAWITRFAVCGVVSVLDPNSGLRVVRPPEDVVYPLAKYPCTARALAEGSAFVAGVDLSGSDPAKVGVLQRRG
jgi:hypothetical protein